MVLAGARPYQVGRDGAGGEVAARWQAGEEFRRPTLSCLVRRRYFLAAAAGALGCHGVFSSLLTSSSFPFFSDTYS